MGSLTLGEMLKATRVGGPVKNEAVMDAAMRRHRKPKEACWMPSTLHATLEAGKYGCTKLMFKTHGGANGAGYLFYTCIGKQQHSIVCLEVDTQQIRWEFSCHLGLIYDMAFDTCEQWMVTASADGTVMVCARQRCDSTER